MTLARRRASGVQTAIFLGLGLGVVWAQGQQPVFRTGVELVRVDVVVLDEEGRPVRGLTPDDFTLVDRTAPMEIAAFSEVAHVRDDTPGPPRPPLDVPIDVADNLIEDSERVVVLVIDDLNIWRVRGERVKDMARRIVNGLGPDVSLSVLFASGRQSIEVTEDRAAVLEAIESFDPPNFFFRNPGICRPDNITGCYVVKTIEESARALGSLDQRRKAVIVISEWQGFDPRGLYEIMHDRPQMVPSGLSYAMSDDPAEALANIPSWKVPWGDFTALDLLESLRDSNVTLYGMDPRQFDPTEEEIRREKLCVKGATNILCGGYINQLNLKLTTEASGGFALIDRDTFDAGIERIVADLDNYYLLGFYPEDPEDKGWHPLTVMVNRPGLTVRHRVGYRLGSEPEPPENDDPMVALSAGALPRAGLPIRLFATPVARTGRDDDVRVAVAAEVRVPASALERPGGRLEETVRITALAANLDKKNVAATARHEVDLDVPAARVWPDGDVTYEVVFGMDLRPASYQLRVSVESARTDQNGSVYLPLAVPNVRDERIAIAGPIVGFARDGRRAASQVVSEDGLLPAGLDPVLDRIFTPEDVLRVYYQVWRRDERDEATARLEVLDEAGRVVVARDDVIESRATGVVDVTVPLSGLPPGAYRVKISAGTSEHEASREVGIAVRRER